MIQTAVKVSVLEAFQCPACKHTEERAGYNSLAEPDVTNHVRTHTIDLQFFTLPVYKFVKSDVEKLFLEKAYVSNCWNVSINPIMGHKTKAQGEFPLQKMDPVRSPSPLTDISDDKRMNPDEYRTLPSSNWSCIRRYDRCLREESSKLFWNCRKDRFSVPLAHKVNYSKPASKFWYML